MVSEEVTKDEINRFEKAKQQIKVKDVLNEQGTMEDLDDDDEPYPTQRRLVSRESETHDNMHAMAVVSSVSAAELAAEREKEEIALQRKRMAD